MKLENLAGPEGAGRYLHHESPVEGIDIWHTPVGRAMWVDGMVVSHDDVASLTEAIAAAPADVDRHDEIADGMRAAAGRAAMRISDAMVRARTIDAVEGWIGVLGDVIDSSPEHGSLHELSTDEIMAHAMMVTCPSTGRRYVHLVPPEIETARAGRKWIANGVDLDAAIET